MQPQGLAVPGQFQMESVAEAREEVAAGDQTLEAFGGLPEADRPSFLHIELR